MNKRLTALAVLPTLALLLSAPLHAQLIDPTEGAGTGSTLNRDAVRDGERRQRNVAKAAPKPQQHSHKLALSRDKSSDGRSGGVGIGGGSYNAPGGNASGGGVNGGAKP